MKALVLERQHELAIRDIDIVESVGPQDVKVNINTVGICGSDVHYYEFGRIGPFVVTEPMVLGHEAAGTVIEVGPAVINLAAGDRVCMEPGIPDLSSRTSRLGLYNLDPAVRFWATPPIHGVLRPTVVHPAAFTFKLPDNVSFAEGAMVEPLAVGMHAASKARIRPGDIAVVLGAGPIGLVTAMAALAGGCSQVIVGDVLQAKLEIAGSIEGILPINVGTENLNSRVSTLTAGWGADVVFECSGNEHALSSMFNLICPGGCCVLVGMPGASIPYDVVAAQVKEARVEHVFRYANVYPRALALMESGKIDVNPLITDTFRFDESIKAFNYALKMPANSIKAQIILE